MKKGIVLYISLLFILLLTLGSNCGGDDKYMINYETGIFPEEVINIEGINSAYDDFNMSLPQLGGDLPLMFSSNRNSQGENFDIVSGMIYFIFDQTNADFTLGSEMIEGSPYDDIKLAVNTSNDELGPYRFFNGQNGLEYFIYSEEDETGNLNLKYLSFLPAYPGQVPALGTPKNITALNGDNNDAYFCIDNTVTTVYFTTDRNGDFDIVERIIDNPSLFDFWLDSEQLTISATDSINSDYNDKCPFIKGNIMLFASDKPGGFGGYDIYYSIFKNSKWSSPYNIGPAINTEDNEYRPLLGSYSNFSNNFLLFSSDRPSGKGGYDLYFSGITFDTE